MKIVLLTFFFFFLLIQVLFRLGADSIFDTAYVGRKYKMEKMPLELTSKSKMMLGDSVQMTSFIPARVGTDWLNFSLSCASFYEEYVFMKRLVEMKKLPKKIVISLHLKTLNNTENCFRLITLSTNLFTFSELKDFYSQPNVAEYYIPTRLNDLNLPLVDLLLSKLFLLPEQWSYLKPAFHKSRKTENENALDFMIKNKGQYLSVDLGETPIEKIGTAEDNQFVVPRLSQFFLHEILKLLSPHKIEVVFIHPPYTNYYKNFFETSDTLKRYETFFGELERRYPIFKYRSEILFLPDDHFIDIGHASTKGAEVYSNWFKTQYQE